MPKTEFFITDGSSLVRQDIQGKFRFVEDMSIADSWDSYSVADAVLQNSIPVSMRNKCYIAIYKNGDFVKCSLNGDEKAERRERITAPNKEKKNFVLKEYSFDDDPEVQQLIDGFESVKEIFESARSKFRVLEEKLCTLDYIDEDMKHYLGYTAINACEGCKLTKAKKEVFIKRVSIKNQMEIVSKLNKHYSDTIEHIKDICKTIDELRNQTYTPRVLIELFENDNFDIDLKKFIN